MNKAVTHGTFKPTKRFGGTEAALTTTHNYQLTTKCKTPALTCVCHSLVRRIPPRERSFSSEYRSCVSLAQITSQRLRIIGRRSSKRHQSPARPSTKREVVRQPLRLEAPHLRPKRSVSACSTFSTSLSGRRLGADRSSSR